ncbi:FAD-dependent oxidoreductase domain-containing protein 1, partial [Stegodyphus mimosarum]
MFKIVKSSLLRPNFVSRFYPKPRSSEDVDKIQKYKDLNSKDKVKKNDPSIARKDTGPTERKFPKYTDYAIVGGGVMGSAIAYFMKQRDPHNFQLMVVERDPKYTRSSTAHSVGGIRQQFSLPENIQLSMYGVEFLKNIKQHLSVSGDDPPDVQFQPNGYLFLATEEGAKQMIQNHKIQKELGAKVDLLRPKQLSLKFSWLNLDGVEMGSYGFENEGWFDPWTLLCAFKKKAVSLGANYIHGEVIGFEFEDKSYVADDTIDPTIRTHSMYIKDEVGEVHCVEFGNLIITAGPYSGDVVKMLHDGLGPEFLKIPLPVEPRKRYVYVINCEKGPGKDMPLTIDLTGTYARPEGFCGNYLCGRSPLPNEEPDVSNLEVDYDFFQKSVWPALAYRIPAFEAVKVSSAWAGYYDYNTFDQNALFGPHPYFPNVFFATGFSGHGIQMAPAIGRAMTELLLDKAYVTIDMSRFHLYRVFKEEPLYEQNIV